MAREREPQSPVGQYNLLEAVYTILKQPGEENFTFSTPEDTFFLGREDFCADEGGGSCMVLAVYSDYLDPEHGQMTRIDHTHLHDTGKIVLLNSISIAEESKEGEERVISLPSPSLDRMLERFQKGLQTTGKVGYFKP